MTGGGHAAQAVGAFDQHGFRAVAGRAQRRSDSGGPPARDQYIDFRDNRQCSLFFHMAFHERNSFHFRFFLI